MIRLAHFVCRIQVRSTSFGYALVAFSTGKLEPIPIVKNLRDQTLPFTFINQSLQFHTPHNTNSKTHPISLKLSLSRTTTLGSNPTPNQSLPNATAASPTPIRRTPTRKPTRGRSSPKPNSITAIIATFQSTGFSAKSRATMMPPPCVASSTNSLQKRTTSSVPTINGLKPPCRKRCKN